MRSGRIADAQPVASTSETSTPDIGGEPSRLQHQRLFVKSSVMPCWRPIQNMFPKPPIVLTTCVSAEIMAFSGPAPERINGRLAMLGFVAAVAAELVSGEQQAASFLRSIIMPLAESL